MTCECVGVSYNVMTLYKLRVHMQEFFCGMKCFCTLMTLVRRISIHAIQGIMADFVDVHCSTTEEHEVCVQVPIRNNNKQLCVCVLVCLCMCVCTCIVSSMTLCVHECVCVCIGRGTFSQ